ncbi:MULTISPECIES: hypothetical protein [Leptospira]|uniref:hypothetical protein n=1 Tax=Leptospira TaxID=171 RepID=UPI00097C46A1|nr:hypothetical protein [Leptospira borgpetersenii]OOV41744.1 hypothetical protein B1H38_17250 [Leptospira borgpetersenii serovar Ballum]QHE27969.1 hypothetical protein GS524_14085 [Leptospira borgpetersenii]QHE31275.1 hypothetical protein GS523_14085 [Leptospira borgpetersenii]QHE34576.1 hypothetical protein GS517_14075 [Leptospira borgpetersenii]QHE37807.1 hypothetical protein GS510_13725 [Leptospira borgpetersenii]
MNSVKVSQGNDAGRMNCFSGLFNCRDCDQILPDPVDTRVDGLAPIDTRFFLFYFYQYGISPIERKSEI